MNRAERRRLEKEAKKRAKKSGGDPAADVLSPAAAQTLNLALQHHGAGRLPEAEAAYRQILSENPKHAATLHFMGVIAYQSGEPGAAVELIERALTAKPDLFEAWNNLGAAYRQLGRTAAPRRSHAHSVSACVTHLRMVSVVSPACTRGSAISRRIICRFCAPAA